MNEHENWRECPDPKCAIDHRVSSYRLDEDSDDCFIIDYHDQWVVVTQVNLGVAPVEDDWYETLVILVEDKPLGAYMNGPLEGRIAWRSTFDQANQADMSHTTTMAMLASGVLELSGGHD